MNQLPSDVAWNDNAVVTVHHGCTRGTSFCDCMHPAELIGLRLHACISFIVASLMQLCFLKGPNLITVRDSVTPADFWHSAVVRSEPRQMLLFAGVCQR